MFAEMWEEVAGCNVARSGDRERSQVKNDRMEMGSVHLRKTVVPIGSWNFVRKFSRAELELASLPQAQGHFCAQCTTGLAK